MINLLILFDNKTLEKMNEDKENYYQVIQTLEEFNSNIGIIKCLCQIYPFKRWSYETVYN